MLRSVHWIPDPDSALSASDFQEANEKKSFLSLLCTVLHSTVLKISTFTSVFKDKNSIKSYKTVDPDPYK